MIDIMIFSFLFDVSTTKSMKITIKNRYAENHSLPGTVFYSFYSVTTIIKIKWRKLSSYYADLASQVKPEETSNERGGPQYLSLKSSKHNIRPFPMSPHFILLK